MKTKTIATFLCLAVFSTFLMAPASSWAGSPQSHRWEGVAIGIGAAIIGSALIKAYHQPPAPAYRPAAIYPHRPGPPQPVGYWQTQREWVAPQHQKVWNPGHYNRHGRWVPGQWIQTAVQPGYWVETRVWVRY